MGAELALEAKLMALEAKLMALEATMVAAIRAQTLIICKGHGK